MTNSVFVYDPTAFDELSKTRGVGRYLQILKENFPQWIFTPSLNKIPPSSIFINPFFNFLQPPLTYKRLAKKQIAVIHDLIPLKYPKHFPAGWRGKLNIFLNKLVLKNYHLIITDSYAVKKDIIQILKINEKKIKVIYPCLPKIFTSQKIKTTPKTLEINANDSPFDLANKYCLYVGDATWNKNLVNLAKAIKIINVTCVFVGKVFENLTSQRSKQKSFQDFNLKSPSSNLTHPWQKELKEFLVEIKNDKRFIFLGFIDDYRLIKLYQQAQCNILISRDEGFGFSYLEAASQGCPSVLSDIEVLKEISNNQGTFFCQPSDPNDIANKIGEIYFNDKLRNQLGSAVLKRANIFRSSLFKKQFQQIL